VGQRPPPASECGKRTRADSTRSAGDQGLRLRRRTCQQPTRLVHRQVRDLDEAPQCSLRVEGRIDLIELRDQRVHHRTLVRLSERASAADWRRRLLLPRKRERQAGRPGAATAAEPEATTHRWRGASAALHPVRVALLSLPRYFGPLWPGAAFV
jgi:hypothetical protein